MGGSSWIGGYEPNAELALADELGVRGVSYSSLPPEGAGDWSLLGRRFQLRKRSSSPTPAYSPVSPATRTDA
jgi:hypothetical protein